MKIKYFVSLLLTCLIYPVFKLLTANNGLIAFSDASLICGAILSLVGVFNWLLRSGDYDLTSYIVEKSFKKTSQSYDAYKQDKLEERKKGFNYPLAVGFIMLAIAIISSLFC